MPQLLDFQFLRSLLTVILELLETPVIGWVLKIVGFFYLLWMLSVGALSLRKQQPAAAQQPPADSFDDYEIVEDDEDSTTNPTSDTGPKFLSE